MLWGIDEGLLFITTIVAFFAAMEIAFRLGRRHSLTSDDVLRSHVNGLQAAVLGLLALLLGFNFAMAVARFDARKVLLQEEVNAINTTYLRAQLLAPQERKEVTELLGAYVRARVDFMRAVIDNARIEAAVASANKVEAQLWSIASRLVEQNASAVPTSWFIQSVNEMINVNEKRRAALDADAQRIVPALFHNGIPNPLLQEVVARGETGLGASHRFYDWAGADAEQERARASREFASLQAFLHKLARESVADRDD